MSIIYKISALWAGKEGSLLLWNFANLLVASIFVNYGKKDVKKIRAMTILMTISSTLLILNLFTNPFKEIPFTHINGIGMNPVLRTPEMIFHPPFVFFGYALVALVYSSHLSGIQDRYIVISAWIFLTVGIVLGGFWAYRTLGWGGFWGWDPVENASLLPWLSLTAYFHVRKSKEFFAYLALVFVIFTAFITRSGILESVHTFGEDPLGFAYFAIFLLLLIPIIRKWKIEDFCSSSLLFSAMIIVVFLGTFANLFRNVDRSYYLLTFSPLFLIAVFGIIYKLKNSKRKILHLGVILLFIGSVSVWFFEEKKTILLDKNSGVEEFEFLFQNSSILHDGEKSILKVRISSKIGIFEPEIHFYDNWEPLKKVSIIMTPFYDYYVALNSFSEDFIIIEFYRVPLIIFVWIGSLLMLVGAILGARKVRPVF
ncbi:MAG: cytochrome c biogenesis protein CcsA [Archaeoglobaceae archaeon]|nr:cytochrome c biogenesis protein CcsA [Archaeoglobaceae archaeon]MDW7989888.1 cytochrome c biogenesis protein CcsA [Archaeoglobaceae archaeon]